MIRFDQKEDIPFFGYNFVTFHDRKNFREEHP